MPRPLDLEVRAAQVVDAVWAVAARDGLASVTARSVAAQAEISLGSVTRAFPTQESLHVEAMSKLVSRVQQRLDAVRSGPPGGPAVPVGVSLLEQVVPLDDTTHTEALVYYDYLARSRTRPELRAIADAVDAALRRLCVDVVSGVLPSRAAAEQDRLGEELHALTEGLAFGLVTWPHLRSREHARRTIERWLRGVGSRP